jgi:hypothetical protein
MRIAFVGWGSLIWNPGKLPLATNWTEVGPILPIEFSRISKDGRLTLALTNGTERACPPVTAKARWPI